MSQKIYGFIGLGLIGGSLAKSIRKVDPDCTIIAYTRSKETCDKALSEKLIDHAATGANDPVFSTCDMIFLCAPVGNNIDALKQLKDVVKPGCLLSDVGSVKTNIHEAVHELGLDHCFIGGHPMTGSEKTGLDNANDHLFENAYYILTPTQLSDSAQLEEYRSLVLSFKALPVVLDYRRHDYITAAISHLPHVIASSLVNTVHNLDDSGEHMKMLAAGGFKDITRIASSSPEMWEQICLYNQQNISRVMDEFIRLLCEARDHMNHADGTYINEMFRQSRDYRDSFSTAQGGALRPTFRIYCDVIDESGAIATIATILAVSGISIKNIGIVHNREFEEGVLNIEFYDGDSAVRAAAILRHHRYTVWENRK